VKFSIQEIINRKGEIAEGILRSLFDWFGIESGLEFVQVKTLASSCHNPFFDRTTKITIGGGKVSNRWTINNNLLVVILC